MNQRAEYTWKDAGGSSLLVAIRGEIDHHTAVSIRTGIDALLFEKRPVRLVLDLSAVTFMDSSGLGLIMGRYGIMHELGGEMCVRDPSPETRSILTLAGMERMVRIEYETVRRDNGKIPSQEGLAPHRVASRSGRTSSRRTAPSRKMPASPQTTASGTRQGRRKVI